MPRLAGGPSLRRLLALAPLLPLFIVDLVYLALTHPPGKGNPFFAYLLLFTCGVGALSVVLGAALSGAATRLPVAVGFLGPALLLCVVEELCAYTAHAGIFQDGRHTIGAGLLTTVPALFAWCVGVYSVLRRYTYSPGTLFLLTGVGAWASEVFLGGLFIHSTGLALLVLPAVVLSYTVLIYLPYRLVEPRAVGTGRGRWRLPAGVATPMLTWLLGAILGGVVSRAAHPLVG